MANLACVFGASIICADIVVRLIPSKRNFRIQDSDVFLSASLSLSFGVMVSVIFSVRSNQRDPVHIVSAFFSVV